MLVDDCIFGLSGLPPVDVAACDYQPQEKQSPQDCQNNGENVECFCLCFEGLEA